MSGRIREVLDIARQAIQSPYFGFVQGHAHLRPEDLSQISSLVGKQADDEVAGFENQFAKLVGAGEAVSYAAGRMGFYDLMRILGIGTGDEVILLGFTCSVMANAVLRTGAAAVFSDVDQNTYGSTARAIESSITPQTKMIVAQHSFGIPCDIEPIVRLARSRDIFLLEDCALTLGSRVDGVVVGNFGDAALFSTDHSKPLNTLIGGFIYTKNAKLARRLRQSQSSCPDLPKAIQHALWNRFMLERTYCVPEKYGRMGIFDCFSALKKKMFGAQGPFLSDDFGSRPSTAYPYPAKLPAFLAVLGLIEVRRWAMVASERKTLLRRLLDEARGTRVNAWLPSAYKNEHFEIVPLRLAWVQPDGAKFRRAVRHFIHTSWTWFMQPIVATREPLESFGYRIGICPVSERIGQNMVNIPCNIPPNDAEEFIGRYKKAIA